MSNTAFITGANGITGGAIAKHIIHSTSVSDWKKVIVTSRKPTTPIHDTRVVSIALDFTKDVEELTELMKPVCGDVTHAFFASYVHKDDFRQLYDVNRKLFQSFLAALIATAPNLRHVTLQTGGKHYNLHLVPVPTPVREEDPPQRVEMDNFYHAQEEDLRAVCAERKQEKQQTITWNVIRPQAIIGSTEGPNGMNEALTLALYFQICQYLDIEAPMPTNEYYWEGTEDVSSSALLADLSVYTALQSKCANEAFNVVNGDHFIWKYMWPRLAAYFGAKASSAQKFSRAKRSTEDDTERARSVNQEFSFVDWSKDKREVWNRLCDERNCASAKSTFDYATWPFQDWVFQREWTATLSINKARKYGWNGHLDSFQNFIETFEDFERQGLIPKRSG